MQKEVWERIERTAKNIAEASGAIAEVKIDSKTSVTYNNPQLTQMMLPTLQRITNNNAIIMDAVMGAEDFSFFGEKVPSLYLYVGGMPAGKDPKTTAAHHTPDFFIDEAGMQTGIKALVQMVIDYSKQNKK
jgi:amidohydrolase